MDNSRLQDLIFMFSYITKYPENRAKELILMTKTGTAIKEKQAAVWYEQQTENLYLIAKELADISIEPDISMLFTVSSISDAFHALLSQKEMSAHKELSTIIRSQTELKQAYRKQLKQSRKEQLQDQYKNLLDLRGI